MELSESQTRMTQHRFRLRGGLKHWVQTDGATQFVVLEDPLRNKYYRIGRREWDAACRLDGTKTLAELASPADLPADARRSCVGAAPLDLPELVQLTTKLHQMQLLEGTGGSRLNTPQHVRWNPFFIRIPLGNPDELLAHLRPVSTAIFSRWGILIWMLIVVTGSYCVFSQWSRFVQGWQGILSVHNWIFLFLVWIGLKAVHETCHGLACKHFGGHVPQAGMAFILFSPVAYVDVTSAWRFTDKWQRIMVSAAGMYAEFFCAAIAALIWYHLADGIGSQVCHNLIVSASLSTLAFNANFIMRFDGYYIVSDMLRLPNLYGIAGTYSQYLGKRLLLGIPAVDPTRGIRFAWFVRAYSMGTLLWRVSVSVGMVLVASTLFHGAGILLSLFAVVTWWCIPLAKWAKQQMLTQKGSWRGWLRAGLLSSCGMAGLAALLWLPWPGGVQAPGIVDYAPLPVVRVETDGFVRKIAVAEGDVVAPGALLAVLENAPLRREWADAERQLQQTELRARIHQRNGEIEKYMMEHESWEMWHEKAEDLARRVQNLEIRAPIAGRVIASQLESRLGQYLAKGDSLLSLGVEREKEIVISISQDDVEAFEQKVGNATQARVLGFGRVPGAMIEQVQPRGSLQLPHAALGASLGGPLAVRPSSSGGKANAGDPFELLQPRFVAHVKLPANQAEQLYAGQLAKVRVPSRLSIAAYCQGRLERWVQTKLTAHKK